MLSDEVTRAFNDIRTLACLKLSPECNGNERAMRLLNIGIRSFDNLQKVLNEPVKGDNQPTPENSP